MARTIAGSRPSSQSDRWRSDWHDRRGEASVVDRPRGKARASSSTIRYPETRDLVPEILAFLESVWQVPSGIGRDPGLEPRSPGIPGWSAGLECGSLKGPARSPRFAIEPLRPTRNQANSPWRAPSARSRPSRRDLPESRLPSRTGRCSRWDSTIGSSRERRHGTGLVGTRPHMHRVRPSRDRNIRSTLAEHRAWVRLQEPHVSDHGRPGTATRCLRPA